MIIAFLRTIILYLVIIAGIRLMGKHQVGEMEPSELVLALLIADLAAVPMQDFGIPLFNGVIPIIALICVAMILSVLTVKSLKIRSIICGKPSIVVEQGEMRQSEMQKNRLTIDELMEELRLQGITDLSRVKYAILETSGQLSVLLYPEYQPVTAGQMSLNEKDGGLTVPLINDGRLITENLKRCGVDENWLKKQLKTRGFHSHKEVFIMMLDENKRIYFAPKEVSK
ncbi:MAG: DUF421 domain-containing protein [Oscillospiraceae bacterium]|nr:DUF421 domain-containing protein [Oscillospiraceae bacterium]